MTSQETRDYKDLTAPEARTAYFASLFARQMVTDAQCTAKLTSPGAHVVGAMSREDRVVGGEYAQGEVLVDAEAEINTGR